MQNNGSSLLVIDPSNVERRGTGVTVNHLRNMPRFRGLGWLPESPIRHFIWGVLIAACGALTIFGMMYLLGQ